jgi:glycosyl transferase family 11
MVVLPLVGGLGNQLFIRAFGYALEAEGNEVVFDRTPLDNDDARGYVLDKFNCEVPFGQPRGERLQEPDLIYHPEFLRKYDRDATLTGYWQSEKYWSPAVQEKIKKSFVLRQNLSDQSLSVAGEIANSNSVSLHVRRTDNLHSRSLHGLLSDEWYEKAIDRLIACIDDLDYLFFVFSDDIEWCKNHIADFGHTTIFVDHNAPGCVVDSENVLAKAEGGQHEDLILMAMCKHHIVARSTFSWWGAYLGGHPKKVVVAPKVWFLRDNELSRDIIPNEWATV